MRHNIFLKAFFVLALAMSSRAGLKNFTFRGTVAWVDDRNFQLPATVTNGSSFEGFFVFDTSIVDENTDSGVGDYWHRSGPVGITVKVGPYVFRTHPDHVEFLVEVVNRPQQDNYLLRSYHNVSSIGLPVEHISWQLDDATGAALSTDALPLTPPSLAAFQSVFGLDIRGPLFGGFLIRGHVTAIEETPLVIPTRPEVSIVDAVEISFPTKLGYFYQVQFSHDMETWNNFGSPMLGTGEALSAFVRKVPGQAMFYRAEIANTP